MQVVFGVGFANPIGEGPHGYVGPTPPRLPSSQCCLMYGVMLVSCAALLPHYTLMPTLLPCLFAPAPPPKAEAQAFFLSLAPPLVHVASDVPAAMTHVKSLLAGSA